MARRKVQLIDNLKRVIWVDPDATYGATVGVNVFNEDGSLFQPAPSSDPGNDLAVTVWQYILYVPPNVVALAEAVGTGLFAVTGPSTGAFRAITQGDGIDVTFGDGVGGDPVVAHGDTSSVANVAEDNSGATFLQDVSFTFDQFGHVTAVNFTSALAQHNDTGGKQGGATGEYYHFTEAEHTGLLPWASESPDDFVNTTGNQTGIAGDKEWLGKQTILDQVMIGGDASLVPFTPAFSIEFEDSTALSCAVMLRYNNSTTSPFFAGFKSRGTIASPLAVNSGDDLFSLRGSGMNTSGVLSNNLAAAINFRAAEQFTSTANGTQIRFITTPIGSTTGALAWTIEPDTTLLPGSDNTSDVGDSIRRVRQYYGINTSIITSDAREKQDLRDLTPNEIACAIELARLPCAWRWIESVKQKGNEARLHCSPTVQAVMAVFQAHGIDPFRWGAVCYDKWEELPEITDEWEEERDKDGNVIREAGSEVVQPYRPAGDRYSLRPSELAWFVIRGQAARQDALESRIAALEK